MDSPSRPLRGYQLAAADSIMSGFGEFRRQLLVAATGCHRAGHPILMADGTIKSVEDVACGDRVMGPDSRPRNVVALHRGRDEMFRITPSKGEAFVVNAGHILHLIRTSTGRASEDNKIRTTDISVRDYLAQNKTFRHVHKLQRVPIEFAQPVKRPWHIDPYILGVVLGDGCLHCGNVAVTTPDKEIVAALNAYARSIESGLRHAELKNNKASTYIFKRLPGTYGKEFLLYCLRKEGLAVRGEQKFVPHHYKTADRASRRQLLAGLLDTDGYCSGGGYDFVNKSPQLAQDVVFLARSLGLAAYQSQKVVKGRVYYRISISGDCSRLPLRIDRKRAPERLQIKDPLVAGFSVTPEGPGEFFGFSLDADHLYVDGNFTVHHNSGKTQIFCEVARRLQPERSLILCHREELIDQAARRLASFGIAAEVEMADRLASLDAPAVVGSVQTLMRDDRLKRWPRGHFGLVVADEAHHATSDSWQKVLGYFDTRTLGASATPERSDKRELGRYFENIAYEVGLLDLVKQGWLSPIRVRTVPLGLDLRGARTVGGDYNAEDLGDIIAPELGKIVEVLRSEYRHRKTIVFLPLVSLSRLFAKLCQEAGLTAWHVDGTSKDRADILSEFSSARCGILSNAMLLTEGYDEPSIDCVVCLRPTKIRSLYCQIVGRGTRVYPNKDHLLLLDFLWLTADHSLIKPANLVAKDNQEAEAVTRLLKDQEDLEAAVESAAEVRTRNLSERLEVNRARPPRFFDPLEFAVSLRDLELAEFEPTMPWHGDRVTIKQIKMLSRYGIDHRNVATKGHAAAILDRIFTRSRLRLATPKQLIWLRKLSHPAPELASFEEATRFLEGKFAKRSPEAVAA